MRYFSKFVLSAGLVFLLAMAARAAQPSAMAEQDPTDRFLLACSMFPSTVTEAGLRAEYGAGSVVSALVPDYWGADGDTTKGVALFGDSPDRLELAWRTLQGVRQLWLVTVESPKNRWHTTGGVVIGMDLVTLEQLNGRPFLVNGFEGDDNSSVQSWSGGKLRVLDGPSCRVRVSLMPRRGAEAERLTTVLRNRELQGEGLFPSSDAVVRELNPQVVRLAIER